MATSGSEPQAFAPALSVTALHPHLHQHHQHHGGTGGAGFNLPLNRGLERALEEAANSGGLNLSARKLKEFPRTAAPGHDLSDTVQAGETWLGPATRVPGCRAFPPGPSVLLDWLSRSGFCYASGGCSGHGGPLGPATCDGGAGAQGCAQEPCLARGKWGISGDLERVRNMNQVMDLYMEAFCVLVGGEGQTKVAGPRPALCFPRSVTAPATAPRDRGLLQPERRCQPWFCACASRGWCLPLRPHILVASIGAPRFSLTRPLRGPGRGSVA